MALANRVQRRGFGEGILEAIELSRNVPKFARALIPGEGEANRETGFFFMTLECPLAFLFRNSETGYEKYRNTRRAMLEAYAYGFMKRYRTLIRIVGIGMEPPPKPGEMPGGSQ